MKTYDRLRAELDELQREALRIGTGPGCKGPGAARGAAAPVEARTAGAGAPEPHDDVASSAAGTSSPSGPAGHGALHRVEGSGQKPSAACRARRLYDGPSKGEGADAAAVAPARRASGPLPRA